MAKYVLQCSHPHLEDTDPDPDETFYELVEETEEHRFEVSDDVEALSWVQNHIKEGEVVFRRKVHPRKPQELTKVVMVW